MISPKDIVKVAAFTMDGTVLDDIVESFKCAAEDNLVDASAGSASDRQEKGTIKFSGSVTVVHRKDGTDMPIFLAAKYSDDEIDFVFQKKPGAPSTENLRHTLTGYLPKFEYTADRGQTRKVTYDLAVNGYKIFDGVTTTDMATGQPVV